jgi:hypothetical protein
VVEYNGKKKRGNNLYDVRDNRKTQGIPYIPRVIIIRRKYFDVITQAHKVDALVKGIPVGKGIENTRNPREQEKNDIQEQSRRDEPQRVYMSFF